MIDLNFNEINFSWKNSIIGKSINLDKNLDLFILASLEKKDLLEIIIQKIIDFAIDNINFESAYKDFALLLENINSIIKTLREDKDLSDLSIIIWVLKKNDLFFSNIWKVSAYLVKNTNEVIEITDKEENKKEFLFISEWKIDHLDTIIFATTRLLNYLSYSDFSDCVIWQKSEKINKNIELILKEEKIEKNIWILSFKYYFLNWDIKTSSKIKEKLNDFILKAIDNKFSKKIIAYYLILKEKLESQSKTIQNIFYLSIIFLSIFWLYLIINSIVWTTISNKTLTQAKQELNQAKEYIRLASNNDSDTKVFSLNIQKAQNIIKDLKQKKLFLNDIKNLENDIDIIKKQFNQIETFNLNNDKLIYKIEDKNPIKIVKINKISYLITKNSVIWPIITWRKAKKYTFSWLWNDYFIDATNLWYSIILITKNWKVVEFSKNKKFLYKDVKWQKTWEKSDTILSYNSNIYLIPETKNQIIKHRKIWNIFQKWVPYLKEEDAKHIWKILDIAIDWWIYILKNDLSVVKFFSTPYRLESILLNKLPENYDKETKTPIKIKTRNDLNYVYLLLNNKIWIFKPNTKRFQDTKSLTYMWQIEASSSKIKDFFINHDWDLDILTNLWIYKLNFEENDWKILVR